LNEINALLTDDVMSALNWAVDGPEKMEPEDAAARFLKEQGLVE